MPEELWQEAVEVARVEGVYATSRVLRIDYCRLKERLASAGMAAATASPGGSRPVPKMDHT